MSTFRDTNYSGSLLNNVYTLNLPGSKGKLYTATGLFQGQDHLQISVTNGKDTFVFSKTNSRRTQLMQTKNNGGNFLYASAISTTDNFIIEAKDLTTGKPVAVKLSYLNIGDKKQSNLVNVLTLVAEDRPHESGAKDYNDIYFSLTWYERRG